MTGEARRWLLQWLPEVTNYWTTAKQRRALDGLTVDSTVEDALTLLASENFTSVYQCRAQPGHADLDLLCSTEGYFAAVHDAGRLEIALVCQVDVLDHELCLAGVRRLVYVRDDDGQLTTHAHLQQAFRAGYAGSLRATLATLRATTRPLTPWPHSPRLPVLRHDGCALLHADLLGRLPDWVHTLLGPNLIFLTDSPDQSRSLILATWTP